LIFVNHQIWVFSSHWPQAFIFQVIIQTKANLKKRASPFGLVYLGDIFIPQDNSKSKHGVELLLRGNGEDYHGMIV
jgi:hypothetical protein